MKSESHKEFSKELPNNSAHYVSPRRLAERWDCSRTTAQRIANRAGITRVFLGEGRNGTVRYRLDEIEAYEKKRLSQ